MNSQVIAIEVNYIVHDCTCRLHTNNNRMFFIIIYNTTFFIKNPSFFKIIIIFFKIIFSTSILLYDILLTITKNKFEMSLQVISFIFSNIYKSVEEVSRRLSM